MTKSDLSLGPDGQRLAYFILKKVNLAVRQYGMIRPHDRIAVAVSGGKDSLALLALLQWQRSSSPVSYELAAIHVRIDARGVIATHGPLLEWLQAQGVSHRIVEPEIALNETVPLNCQRCTWIRKKALFSAAGMLGCNVVAFAHHADDAAQTTLLNLLYAGSLHTLAPTANYFDGQFRLIRPLLYVPEKELSRFASVAGFPPSPPACPRAGKTARRRIAEMLRLMGREYATQARPNLIRLGLSGQNVKPET
jgi:tRNA 2-thiocytidine biosynthesis protein TtcA